MTSVSGAYRPAGSLVTTAVEPLFQPHFGLPVSMQYVYGSVRSKYGRYYWPIRGSYRRQARHLHLSVAEVKESGEGGRTGDRVGDFQYAVGTGEGYEGPVTWERTGEIWEVRRDDGQALIAAGDGTLSWTEEGALEIEGEICGPAIRFAVDNNEWPFTYTSRLFRVSRGVIQGKAVRGYIFHDTLHLPDGENFLTSPYQRQLQGAWVAFVTEFEDGAVHAGHLVYGLEGFAVLAIHRTDGPPLLTTDFDVDVEVDDDDFPTRVAYSTPDQTWVWEGYVDAAAGHARMPVRTDVGDDHRWVQGVVRLEGETRKVIDSEALMETYQHRLRSVITSQRQPQTTGAPAS